MERGTHNLEIWIAGMRQPSSPQENPESHEGFSERDPLLEEQDSYFDYKGNEGSQRALRQ